MNNDSDHHKRLEETHSNGRNGNLKVRLSWGTVGCIARVRPSHPTVLHGVSSVGCIYSIPLCCLQLRGAPSLRFHSTRAICVAPPCRPTVARRSDPRAGCDRPRTCPRGPGNWAPGSTLEGSPTDSHINFNHKQNSPWSLTVCAMCVSSWVGQAACPGWDRRGARVHDLSH